MRSIPGLLALSLFNFVFFIASESKVAGYLNLFVSGMSFGAAIIRLGLTMGWYKL